MLHGNRAENAALGPHREAFLGFDGGLDAVRPAAVLGDASGPVVDQLDDPVADDVVAIAAEQRLRVQRDVEGAQEQLRSRIVERHSEPRAGADEAGLGQPDRAAVLVGVVVDAAAQVARERGETLVIDRQRWTAGRR